MLTVEDAYGGGAVISLDILRHEVVFRERVVDIAVRKFDRQAAVAQVLEELRISRPRNGKDAKAAFILFRGVGGWSARLCWGDWDSARVRYGCQRSGNRERYERECMGESTEHF